METPRPGLVAQACDTSTWDHVFKGSLDYGVGSWFWGLSDSQLFIVAHW